MTTLVVSGARALGSALVQTAGQVALSYANAAISSAFDSRSSEGPRLDQFHLLTSRDGSPMARTFGRVRLAGQVIWASRLKETSSESQQGGKGGGATRTDYSYTISFAIGLCEGVVQSVDRLWVNGAPLATSGITMRVYTGSETQNTDPIISAIEGANAPAFRGTAYIVFEDFPLDDFGARLPQINAEVTRHPKYEGTARRLEQQIKAVHLLPSSGEFAYATEIVEDISSPGAATPVNMNNMSGDADIIRALDQLETALPECRDVSIVISWFGSDLRVGECVIQPGVETGTRLLQDGAEWRVNGITRADAYQVSQDVNAQGDLRPNYGGTPSDASIVSAIKALKLRGYRVTIYPFILMDIPSGNDLTDPYGGVSQSAFPWRGRITCDPAPGQDGTPDQSASIADDVAQFFGQASASDFSSDSNGVTYNGPDEFSYRRFILHYAKLAALAGGVETFLIGSEMRGLTTLRSSRSSFPAVDALRDLASDVKSVLPNAKISYAADWSEYFGYHPQDGTGDVHFHLDDLWVDTSIDAVAIDAYFPLSDWRDGSDHIDAQIAPDIYDTDYLTRNVEGGEGYDWYYATEADRDTQTRTLITDGEHNKPWVFRYKDLRNWWQNAHYPREDGVETGLQTAWRPREKPVWLMEVGCPAVDKGANQPNVFYNPKSDESRLPYHSSGVRDDLIQRRYLETITGYWDSPSNPVSDVYNGPMIDTSRSYAWCWDARPFPDFPARNDVWADGGNWQLGHWLTGRVGLVAVADVVYDLVSETGLSAVDTRKIPGLVEGYMVDRPMSARAAITPLSLVYGFDMVERASGLTFIPQSSPSASSGASFALDMSDIVARDSAPIQMRYPDPNGKTQDVRVHYVDSARDFQNASISARDAVLNTAQILDINTPIVMDAGFAAATANRLLQRIEDLDREVSFTLSPSRLDIEVGDTVVLPNETGVWQITEADGPGARRVSARPFSDAIALPNSGGLPGVTTDPAWVPKPVIIALDIPNFGSSDRAGLMVGAIATPFSQTEISSGLNRVTVNRSVRIGVLTSELRSGPTQIWDRHNTFTMAMAGAELSSVEAKAALSGENRFAVQTNFGWEVLTARKIELTASGEYQCSDCLRGLFGTDTNQVEIIPVGAQIIWLNGALVDLPINASDIDGDITLSAVMAGRSADPLSLVYTAQHLRPLSPVHGRITRSGADMCIGWIRRTRNNGDSWVGLDVPMGEDQMLFRVQAMGADGMLRATFDVDTTALTVPLSDTTEWTRLTVAQGSQAYGFGPKLTVEL